MPHRTARLISALGILVAISCGRGADSTRPLALPSEPTGPVNPTIPSSRSASELAFTVQPAATFAGMPINPPVQVTVQDSLGQTVTTTPVSVTLTLAPGETGSLQGTLIAATVNGVATCQRSCDFPHLVIA